MTTKTPSNPPQILLCHSKNNISVTYDPVHSHVATHFNDTTQLKSLVTEVIASLELTGQVVAKHSDMGRVVGTCDVVTTDETDAIMYAKRKNRDSDGLVPFTTTRQPQPCRFVSVYLTPKADGTYELASAWIGTFGDDEPFPQAPDANDKSVAFWNRHAFVWGSQEVTAGSETTVRPW